MAGAMRIGMLVGLGVLAQPVLAADSPRATDPKKVDSLVTETLRRWQAPGLALVIVQGDETIHLKGYGVRRTGSTDPVTEDTLFPLASCTKAFTSALTAMLVDEERLGWDDPVRRHLPSFRLSDPHADALVTLRDMLTHRTGVGGHDLLWYRAPWKSDEVLRRIPHLPLTGQFRSDYQYSSLMYLAMGRVLAERGNAPWDRLIRDRLCSPLGMRSIAFTTAEAERFPNRAVGHRRTRQGGIEVMPEYRLTEPNAAGSLHTTARDLGRWIQFHLADGVCQGKRLVSAANLTETRTPHTIIRKDPSIAPIYPESHQVSYAMGWVVYDHRGRKVVAHGGMVDGFRVQVTLLPQEKIGFALLNNLHETKMNIALGNALIDLLLGLPEKDWTDYFLSVEQTEREAKQAERKRRDAARLPGTQPTAPPERYIGEYTHPAYGTGRIRRNQGGLVWEWSSFRAPLEHFQGDQFRVKEGYFEDELLEFAVIDGRPAALRIVGVVFERKPES